MHEVVAIYIVINMSGPTPYTYRQHMNTRMPRWHKRAKVTQYIHTPHTHIHTHTTHGV